MIESMSIVALIVGVLFGYWCFGKQTAGRIKQESPSLRGSLLFLRQVSPSQGKKLYHEYKIKVGTDKKIK